ncbi:hypothetical protein LCM4579_19930 [Ensifer sp. LCM 4579]|nr:EF-hand domain-containing protein [Ensifer sp. LCM 4579]OHV81310.1 hypothetical protein LCM4579_19930 [Ensifer sp. LCM 4579]
MLSMRLPAVAALAVIMTLGSTNIAAAQAADAPQEPEAAPEAPQAETPDQAPQAGQQRAMPGDMMRQGRMGYHGRMMGGRGHMMKMMFAISDADGDGALSFEEISAIHKRIFDAIDADKDGKVTPEEVRAFLQE